MCDETVIKQTMEKITGDTRLEQIPVLYVRGTNYTVGYTIGRTFKSSIHDLLDKWDFFNKLALVKYETPEGKKLYEASLNTCYIKFPKYVEEIEGMCEGADVPFYKLFILHVDTLMMYPKKSDKSENTHLGVKGCTSILCNHEEMILGHTEDADSEMLNNIYIVAAEIIDDNGKTREKFTTLTYAGHLPGYTMGFNHHGMIYSVNTLYPTNVYAEGTPRAFLARALLNASNLRGVVKILNDKGNGIADGISVNLYFSKQTEDQEPLMYNIEVGPGSHEALESTVDVLTLQKGESLAHCNRYLRINIPENLYETNIHRHYAIARHPTPVDACNVRNILSDQSDPEFPIFRTGNKEDSKTVAAGIFEIHRKQWKIYIGKPNESEPVAILTLP